MMSEAAREAKRAYMKDWRVKNPNKVKEHQASYWERQAAKQEDTKEVQQSEVE